MTAKQYEVLTQHMTDEELLDALLMARTGAVSSEYWNEQANADEHSLTEAGLRAVVLARMGKGKTP